MVCRPGMSVRDTSQPIGAATRQQIMAELLAIIAVVSNGSRKSGLLNNLTKFCSVGWRALSVKANSASHDSGSTISTIMTAANSHSTGRVQSMRGLAGERAVVRVMLNLRRHSGAMRSIEPGNLETPRCAVAHLGSGPSDQPGMTIKIGSAHSHTLNNRA